MAKYDGLIIPRSYNDYINKSDPAGVAQALQLTGVMDNAPTAQSTKPVKSGGIFAANAVIMANKKTLSGVAISAGSVVRVLFTAALTGSDATTGLTLIYNGNTYAVKVGKNGALANFLANNIDGSYIYCQAYTTLDLMFDGSQFIIMGNPVVISSADYTIYTDGTTKYTKKGVDDSVDNCLRKTVIVDVPAGKWANIQTQYSYTNPSALLVQRYNSSALILHYSDVQPLVRRLSNQAPNDTYTMLKGFRFKRDGYTNNFYIQVGDYGANIAVTLFSRLKGLNVTPIDEPPSDAAVCPVISV